MGVLAGEIDDDPVLAFLGVADPATNGEGFVSEMLAVAGGKNVFAETDVRYPKIDPAELLRRQPDVIIELQPGLQLTDAQRSQMKQQWAELGSVPAVSKHRIHFIADDYALIPGPRVPLLARRFAELLHPDLKGKLD